MKKIGLKTKKTIAGAVLMAAIAIMTGLIGRLLVLGVTTDAMEIGWSDWVRNRNYEDSWTLSGHIGSDLNYILNYIGLKQMLEEADGSLNLERPALVVENEDGSRTCYSMQELVSKGEQYGIYLYRQSDGSMEIRESNRSIDAQPVRVLWCLWNREDALTDLAEDTWAVREERVQAALNQPQKPQDGFEIPQEDELQALSTEELLAMLRAVPEGYLPEEELVSQEAIDALEETLRTLAQQEQEGEETGVQPEAPEEEDSGYGSLYIKETKQTIREELLAYLNEYRNTRTAEDNVSELYGLTRRFLWDCLWDYYHCRHILEETDSNLSYQIVLEEGTVRRVYSDPNTPAETVLTTEDMNAYYSFDSQSQQMNTTLAEESWLPHVYLKEHAWTNYSSVRIVVGLDTNHMVYEDSYSVEAVSYAGYRGQVFGAAGLLAGCAITVFIMLVWLMFLSGHKEGVEGIYLNGYDRIPTELGACGILAMMSCFMFGCLLIIELLSAYLSYQKDGISAVLLIGLLCMEAALVYLILWLGFFGLVRRVKAHTFWKNSLTARVLGWFMKPLRWCGRQMKRMWNLLLNAGDTTWKTLSVFCVYFIINFVWGTSIRYASAGSLLLYLAFNGAVGVFLVWHSSQMKQIHAGVKKIADGSLDYHLPLENLTGEARRLALQINRINVSLKNAIENSVKNERMKTDLITNVSHDIKTPLTSIINYVDLLKRENIEDAKIRGYIDVLDQKSQRLKTLTEDLVEASRASSGTLQLNLDKIDFIELINQTGGEFMDRFEAKSLTVIPSIPAESVYIMADGRYVWRILENLYRNAEKYAMPGTRIYIDVFEKFGRIFFVMKNVSQAPLNIKAEELTERFIRGDVSRSTEGSGLGLSIAKDMTELMNGTFKIYLDGDLFRVTISFAVMAQKKTDLKEMEESIRRRIAEEEAKGAGKLAEGADPLKASPPTERNEEDADERAGIKPDLWDRLHSRLPKLSFGRHGRKSRAENEETEILSGTGGPRPDGDLSKDFYDV